MMYTETFIDYNIGYLIPIGDVHVGDINFTPQAEKKLRGYIQWVKDHKEARVILMGDLFNTASLTSKSSPFKRRNNMRDDSEYMEVLELFSPIKDQIIVAYDGNHEDRMIQWLNESPTLWLCQQLKVPYGGYSGVTAIHVGKYLKYKTQKNIYGYRQNYAVYAHHTTGGGSTVGGKMNRVDKLRQIVCNADIYLGGHNHMLGNVPVTNGMIDKTNKRVSFVEQWLIDCGSYLTWDGGYAEKAQMPPSRLGSPKIELSGTKKRNIHVSL